MLTAHKCVHSTAQQKVASWSCELMESINQCNPRNSIMYRTRAGLKLLLVDASTALVIRGTKVAEIQHINATLSCDSLILEGAHCTLQSAHCTRKRLNISNLYLSWCSIFQSLWADAVDFCQSWKSVDHLTQLPLPWHDFITAMRDKEFWKFH